MFALNQERLGISVTAGSLSLAVLYVSAIAALATDNPLMTYRFLDGLEQKIDAVFQNILSPPSVEIMRQSTTTLRAEAAQRVAHDEFKRNNFASARKWLDRSFALKATYNAYLLASNLEFTANQDPVGAIRAIRNARKLARNNLTWLYNKAFLNFYMGRLQQGYQDYFKLRESTFPGEDDTVNQCIGFNVALLEREPDKVQSHFILGYLQYFKKCNLPQALLHFETFLDGFG